MKIEIVPKSLLSIHEISAWTFFMSKEDPKSLYVKLPGGIYEVMDSEINAFSGYEFKPEHFTPKSLFRIRIKNLKLETL